MNRSALKLPPLSESRGCPSFKTSKGEALVVYPNRSRFAFPILNIWQQWSAVFVISVCMILRKESFPKDFEFQQELAEAGEDLETGGSAIIGPDGSYLAGPLWKEEGILYAELDLNRVIEQSQLLDVAGHYARPDVRSLHLNANPQNVLEKLAKLT